MDESKQDTGLPNVTREGGHLDILWGAEAIAKEIGVNRRQCFYLLDTGKIPAARIGKRWCASRHGLRAHFAAILGGA